MARSFNGTSDFIQASIGALSGITFGSVVALMRPTAGVWNTAVTVADSTGHGIFGIEVDTAGIPAFIGGNSGYKGSTGSTGGTWNLFGASKPTGPNSARLHQYSYASNSFVHQNSINNTIADATAPGGSGFVRIGQFGSASFDRMNGDIAAVALFPGIVISDAQFENLPFSLDSWLTYGPTSMWVLDQQDTSQTVVDLAGGGANQNSISGTSVASSSVPILGYGHPVILRTRQAATASVQNGAAALTAASSLSAGGVATRHNLSPNPAAGANSTGWTGGSTPTRVTGLTGLPVTTGAQYTANGFAQTPTGIAVPGAQYTGSLYVQNNTGSTLGTKTIYLGFTRSTGGDDQTQTASFALPSGITRVSVTGTAPANTTGIYLIVDSFNGTFGSGVTLTGCLLERAPAADTYFDGDTAGASWDGTAENSASTLSPSGVQSGAAALIAVSSLTAGATKAVTGAVAMTAASGLTAGATQAASGAVAMTAASSMTVAATKVQPGAVAMSAASSVTVAADLVKPGAVAMTAGSALTASATQTSGAAVAMTAASSATVAGVRVQPGAVAMTAATSLTAGAAQTSVAVVGMSSASALTTAGTRVQPGAVSMTSASALSAAATSGAATGSTMTAASSLTAGAGQTSAATVAMSAASSLTAAGVRVQPGTSSMTAASGMSVAGALTGQAAAVMSAASSLTAAGTTTTGGTGAILSAASSMTVSAVATGQGAVPISAASNLSANAGGGQNATVSMSAASSLSDDGVRGTGGAASMSAASLLNAGGLRTVPVAAAMSAASSLTAGGSVTSGGASAAMTASSSLTVGAIAQQAAQVSMSALSGLSAGPNLGVRAQVVMTAASSLGATVYVPPQFYQPGILVAGSTRSAPTAGTIPYPRLTAGTVRGPTYASGGGG